MLLDTSGLLCMMDRKDTRFTKAHEFFLAADEKWTHSYVIAELVALATARGFLRSHLFEFIAALQDSSEVEVVMVDKDLHHAALARLRQRLDMEWSLCDAVSFVLMERLDIREALTTDHHFEQAGFVRLL